MLKTILKPIALVAALLASHGPAHAQKTVRVDNATGALLEPTNFFSANASAVEISLAATLGSVPMEESPWADELVPFWTHADGPFITWMPPPQFRQRIGLGEADGPTFDSVGVGALLLDGATILNNGLSGTLYLPDNPGTLALSAEVVPMTRTITTNNGITGGGALSADRTLGLTGQALAVHSLSSNGLVARTGAGTVAGRTLSAAGLATATNGDGVAGNPTITVTAASNTDAITGTATDRANTPASGRAALSSYADGPLLARNPSRWQPWFDGAATDRRIYWQLGAAGNVAGSPLSVVGITFRVPTSNPAATMRLFDISAASSPSGDNRMFAVLDSGGSLGVRAFASSGNERARSFSAFRSAYSGRVVRLTIVFGPGVVAPTVLLTVAADGSATPWGRATDITAQFVDANIGTPPDWMSSALVASYYTAGYGWSGDFTPGVLLNRAITQAEEQQMVESGGLLSVDRMGGSVVPAYASSFVASADGFVAQVGTATGNVDGISDGTTSLDDVLRYTGSGAGGFPAVVRAASGIRYGARTRVRFRYYIPAGNTSLVGLYCNALANLVSTKGAWTWAEVEVADLVSTSAAGGTLVLGFWNGATTSFPTTESIYFRDITVTPVGALLQPTDTGTSQIGDVGPNRIRGQATAGVRIFSDGPMRTVEFPLSSTGTFLTGASTNPLVWEAARIIRAEVVVDTAGADVTIRRNSSSTNDIVTAATDVPAASVLTPQSLINLQRALAAGETIWAGLSTGTGRLIVELERN